MLKMLVLQNPSWFRFGLVWCYGFVLQIIANAASPAPPAPTLTNIAQIRLLTPDLAEKRQPVKITGAITLIDAGHYFFFLQDDTGGIFVHDHDPKPVYQVGDVVELAAVTDKGDFAPVLVQPQVRKTGATNMPPCVAVPWVNLMTGQYDSLRVAVSGVVRLVERHDGWIDLELAVPGGRLPVWINTNAGPTNLPMHLVDAHVQVQGVCGALFNQRRQLTGIRLMAPGMESVVVLVPAASQAEALEVMPVNRLLRYVPTGMETHRVRVQGAVTLSQPGQQVYLQDATGALAVRCRGKLTLRLGDRIDVVGFPLATPVGPMLEDAVCKRLGAGVPVEPEEPAPGSLMKGDYEAALVRLPARLVDQSMGQQGQTLLLEGDSGMFEAFIPSSSRDGGALPLAKGSWVKVTGVCTMQTGVDGLIRAYRLVMRSPSDVTVTSSPSWWTAWRIVKVVGALVLITVLSLGWGLMLRRQVHRQTQIITQKLAREAALEGRYRGLVENAVDMMFLLDAQGRIVTLNSAGEKLIGLTKETARHKEFSQLVVAEQQAQWTGWFARCLADQPAGSCEVDLRCPNGRQILVEIRGRPMQDIDGFKGLEGVARDITERQNAESTIRRLFHAVEQSACSVIITDIRGQIEYVNPKFTQSSGYSLDEVRGKNPRVLKSGEMNPDGYQQMWQTISSGSEWRGEFHNRHKNGGLYWETASISPIRDARGVITHYLAVKEDITERKQLEAEREQLIVDLQDALAKVKTLSGLLPICASCKKIRDDQGYWNQLEAYVTAHSDARFTHGLCPECIRRLYPDIRLSSQPKDST
jgi:PAS domain S-box-containing protein